MASNGDMNGEHSICMSSMVDSGTVESHRLYAARRTVFEMLRDRGYLVPVSELTQSLDEFRTVYGDNNVDLERLRICASLVSNPSRKILVIFGGADEIRKQIMIGILFQIVNKESLDRVILVLQSKMNSYAKKVADDYEVKIETFQITDLLVNVTKHLLVPKHEVLNAEEKQKLLKKYNVKENQIPQMLENDAITRYYGLVKGQVVKFTHIGTLTESLVTYRCVR